MLDSSLEARRNERAQHQQCSLCIYKHAKAPTVARFVANRLTS